MLFKLTDDLLNGFKKFGHVLISSEENFPLGLTVSGVCNKHAKTIPLLNVRLGLLGPDFKTSLNFFSPEFNLYGHYTYLLFYSTFL